MKTLLVATLIAASASMASAECTWVLWNQHHDSWSIEGGYKTANECATHQGRWWDARMKDLNNREVRTAIAKVEGERPNSIFVHLKDGGYYQHRLLCLPDTIDPRKGKGYGR